MMPLRYRIYRIQGSHLNKILLLLSLLIYLLYQCLFYYQEVPLLIQPCAGYEELIL